MALTVAAVPPLTAHTRLLVVAPHPDDETLGNGILIQRVLAAGGRVHVLLLTDGDNNPWPQRYLERRWRLGAEARVRWGRRRRAELDEALQRLGLPATSLTALGWPDLGVFGRLLHATSPALDELAGVVADVAPNLIAVPALRDRHPDHGAAHVLVRLALAGLGITPTLLDYAIHRQVGAVDGDPPGDAVQQQAKRQALAAHHSQLLLGGRRFRRWAERAEGHALVAAAPTGAPRGLPWCALPLWRSRLRLTAASAGGTVQQWPWPRAPLRPDGQGGWRLDWPALHEDEACFVRLSRELPSPWIFERWGWHAI